MNYQKKEKIIGYCFILPAVIYMLVFIGYPIVYNWILSFQDVTALTLKNSDRAFLGLANYKAIFADASFRGSLLHTLIYTIGCLVIQFTLGFLFAMFFAKKFTFPNRSEALLLSAGCFRLRLQRWYLSICSENQAELSI